MIHAVGKWYTVVSDMPAMPIQQDECREGGYVIPALTVGRDRGITVLGILGAPGLVSR